MMYGLDIFLYIRMFSFNVFKVFRATFISGASSYLQVFQVLFFTTCETNESSFTMSVVLLCLSHLPFFNFLSFLWFVGGYGYWKSFEALFVAGRSTEVIGLAKRICMDKIL